MNTRYAQNKKKRITRLSLIAGVIALTIGTLTVLYLVNREPVADDTQQVLDQARAAHQAQDHSLVLALLEAPNSPLSTIPAVRNDVDLLKYYVQARINTPMTGKRHLMRCLAPLRHIVEHRPDDAEARRQLFHVLLSLKREAELLDLAKDLTNKHPHNAELLRFLAGAQMQASQKEQALQSFLAAAQLEPLHVQTHRYIADLLRDTGGSFAAFQTQAERIHAEHPDDPRAELIHAIACLTQQNNDRARVLIASAAQRTPPSPGFAYIMIDYLEHASLDDLAVRYLFEHEVPGINPARFGRHADAYTRSLLRQGQAERVWSTLGPWLGVSPQARMIVLRRVAIDLLSAKDALAWVRAIDSIAPANPDEQLERARAAFWAGTRLDEDKLKAIAFNESQRLIDQPGPHPADAYYLHGQILYEYKHDLTNAEANFRKSFERTPNSTNVLNYLALVLSERGGSENLQEAEAHAQRATQLERDDANLFDTLAIVRLRRGRLDLALRAIDVALEMQPHHPAWHQTRADILQAQGQTHQADNIRQRYSASAAD